MSMAETRTHVVLPAELLERVDRLVGSRRRSRFFAAAVAKEVERLELLEAAREGRPRSLSRSGCTTCARRT